MRRLLFVTFLTFASLAPAQWTSPERVAQASENMATKAQAYSEKVMGNSHYIQASQKAAALASRLIQFAGDIRGGMPFEEASKDFEKVNGLYHHTDRFITETHRKHPNLLYHWRWRGVEWAWEGVSTNMYGTIP